MCPAFTPYLLAIKPFKQIATSLVGILYKSTSKSTSHTLAGLTANIQHYVIEWQLVFNLCGGMVSA
jgi:hypothetical protein